MCKWNWELGAAAVWAFNDLSRGWNDRGMFRQLDENLDDGVKMILIKMILVFAHRGLACGAGRLTCLTRTLACLQMIISWWISLWQDVEYDQFLWCCWCFSPGWDSHVVMDLQSLFSLGYCRENLIENQIILFSPRVTWSKDHRRTRRPVAAWKNKSPRSVSSVWG